MQSLTDRERRAQRSASELTEQSSAWLFVAPTSGSARHKDKDLASRPGSCAGVSQQVLLQPMCCVVGL